MLADCGPVRAVACGPGDPRSLFASFGPWPTHCDVWGHEKCKSDLTTISGVAQLRNDHLLAPSWTLWHPVCGNPGLSNCGANMDNKAHLSSFTDPGVCC